MSPCQARQPHDARGRVVPIHGLSRDWKARWKRQKADPYCQTATLIRSRQRSIKRLREKTAQYLNEVVQLKRRLAELKESR